MKRKSMPMVGLVLVGLALVGGVAISAPDKYAAKVPGGLAISEFPDATVPGNLLNVDFMVKDSKRFAASGGWGYGVFDYDAASDSFKPGTTTGAPPQENDARCGFTCHKRAISRDYVFTEYGKR